MLGIRTLGTTLSRLCCDVGSGSGGYYYYDRERIGTYELVDSYIKAAPRGGFLVWLFAIC